MNTVIRKNGTYYPTLFDSVFGKSNLDQLFPSDQSSHKPAVNILETEGGYRIELAAPGLKKEDFKISHDGDQLKVSAEKKSETGEQKEKYNRKEFSFHSFQRIFTLPDSVDATKISAGYEAGVLNISIPKKEIEASPSPRQIEIA